MLIIDSKDCENIDKALKKYKKKFEKSKVLLQLRERQSFIKPSVRRRGEVPTVRLFLLPNFRPIYVSSPFYFPAAVPGLS
jgi:small subunit ribosomal protein S21